MLGKIRRHISNIPGWRTNRKLVVFESDDWGSVRMPDKKTFEKAKLSNLDLFNGDSVTYNQLDALETELDITSLLQTLVKHKDKNNQHPIFTLLFNVCNPDFEKIKASNFREFYTEPITHTYQRFNLTQTHDAWKNAIETGLINPQFHGREHLNVSVWLKDLQAGNEEVLKAFELGIWGFNNKHPKNISYQAAFDFEDKDNLTYHESILANGLQQFENIFGTPATYFVPPNGPFNNSLCSTAAKNGIKIMSAAKRQQEPLGNGNYRLVKHRLGDVNEYKQVYITRNAIFEPSKKNTDWVQTCLNDMQIAFTWHKPAVISTHRVNYVGGISNNNRENGLNALDNLLKTALMKWPDLEFISSVELANLMMKRT